MQLPDIRQIRAFVALAETGSFTQAAQQLYLTQSAVSHSIRSLEDQLNVLLVERLGKRVSLTSDGHTFLKRCHTVIAELESATRELDAMRRWGQGLLRIGATHSICNYLLPHILREFRESFPRCEIVIESGDTSDLIDMLDKAEIDIALGMNRTVGTWLNFEELFVDQMVSVVSPIHEWASKSSISMKELQNQQIIVYSKNSETHRLIECELEESGLKSTNILALGDMEAIKAMSKIGIGVGIVAPWIARRELDLKELFAIPFSDHTPQRSWGYFTNTAKNLSLIEETFIGIAKLVCRDFTLPVDTHEE